MLGIFEAKSISDLAEGDFQDNSQKNYFVED